MRLKQTGNRIWANQIMETEFREILPYSVIFKGKTKFAAADDWCKGLENKGYGHRFSAHPSRSCDQSFYFYFEDRSDALMFKLVWVGV